MDNTLMIEAKKDNQLTQHAKHRLDAISRRVRSLSTQRKARLITEFIGGMKGAADFNPQQSLVAVEVLELLLQDINR